jgi:general secretion pathway protein G
VLLSLVLSVGHGTDVVVPVTLLGSFLAYLHFRTPKRFGVGVYLLILGLLAATADRVFLVPIERAWHEQARVQMRILEDALNRYKLDNGIYPTTEQGLEALVHKPTTGPLPRHWPEGGYLDGIARPRDPWGVPYIYISPGQYGAGYDLKCLGADHWEGGAGYAADLEIRRGQ